MRTAAILTAAALSALSATAGLAGSHLPATEGKAVIEHVRQTEPYWNWRMWPGKGKLYEGQHPHGAYLSTYLSDSAYEAVDGKAGELPDGAIVVKENYTPKKTLAAITVMYKKKGYNPEAGDWFWLKYAPDGTVQAEGKVDGCIQCHSAKKDNDWLFTGSIGKK